MGQNKSPGKGYGIVINYQQIIYRIFVLTVLISAIAVVTGCGGGGGSDGDDSDNDVVRNGKITIDMAPLRIIGFNDDGGVGGYPKYPMVNLYQFVYDLEVGQTALIRVHDPYAIGGFYSILITNGYGGGPHSAAPLPDDGEPDNSPMEATALTTNTYSHHGLNPVYDEDWFSFLAKGDCCLYVSTKPNASVSITDPVMEIYDARLNLGPVTHREGTGSNERVYIVGVYDPSNNLTLVSLILLSDDDETNHNTLFSFIFAGPAKPGDYKVRSAFPPIPSGARGSVTGSVHVDEYGVSGGKLVGTFDITIVDNSRTTTVSGSFDVVRENDRAGLLNGFRLALARDRLAPINTGYKDVSEYQSRQN